MPDFPQLEIIPIQDLVIHERHDHQRSTPLALRLRQNGVLRNPPIVTPLEDGSGRSMVLDGANRVTALQELGYIHALVQSVPSDDPGLNLHTWNHVIWEMNPRRFLENLHAIHGLRFSRQPDASLAPDLEETCGMALIETCRGHILAVCAETNDLEEKVWLLNALVESYQTSARLDRTSARTVQPLVNTYPSLCGLVIFPSFRVQDLLRLSGRGILLPSGVTRFTISPRALHLNYPLDGLGGDLPLEEKNNRLQKWIQERLAHKGVRYYAEATYLFDE